jgi:alkyl sulfatase BDS1-like metallo-beta-lactamase superfamily hydrolase
VSVDSVALALTSMFNADAADGFNAVIELRLGEHRFRIRVADGRIELARGEADDRDAIIDADLDSLRAVLWQGRELAEALRDGDIRIEGDRRAVARFVLLFPQPESAAPAAVAAG